MKRMLKKQLPMLSTISPVAIWLFLLIAIPLIYVLVLSFMSRDANGDVMIKFTLENYGKLISAEYLKIYAISMLIALISTMLCILISYPFAFYMANGTQQKKNIMMMLVIIPFWTNSLIRLYGWRTLLGAEGPLNHLLLRLGIVEESVEFLYHVPAVVLGMVYTLIPFMILPLYVSIEKLDKTLLEASSDLGARKVKSFLEITLPLTSPGIFAGSIMVFIPSLGYFFVSDLLGGGNTMMIGNLIKNQFYTSRNWPLGAALSITLILLTLLLVSIYKKAGGDMDDLGVM